MHRLKRKRKKKGRKTKICRYISKERCGEGSGLEESFANERERERKRDDYF